MLNLSTISDRELTQTVYMLASAATSFAMAERNWQAETARREETKAKLRAAMAEAKARGIELDLSRYAIWG